MPCAGEASATAAMIFPVDGSSTSTLPSVVIHFPPISSPFGTAFRHPRNLLVRHTHDAFLSCR